VTDPAIDQQQVTQFLDLLQKAPTDTRFRAFYPSGHPAKASDRGRRATGLDLDQLQEWQASGRGAYAVIGHGGHRDADIESVPALFVEWDDRPISWQETAWRELNLPQPTFQVLTGGKSVHTYWVLHRPMPAEAWRAVTRRLIAHCGSDREVANPSRVMRLPGSQYIDALGSPTGMVRIINASPELRYWPEDLTDAFPEEPPLSPAPLPPPPPARVTTPPPAGFVPLEELLPRSMRLTLAGGSHQGARNADAFRLACCALALADAAPAAGLSVAGSPQQLLSTFASRCSPPLDDREVAAVLKSAGATPRTPDLGWPPTTTPPSAGAAGAAIGRGEGRKAPPTAEAPPPVEAAPQGEPIKVNAAELLTILRGQAVGRGLRFNTFTQQIEINGAILEGAERYYLKLAQSGIKATKDLAYDCLVEIARENPYDPVREYLEFVENHVEPEYIGGIASSYLRQGTGEGSEGPTLYDEMIRCTLIGAVRRVFQPGCKHDSACVIYGPQESYKSTFWSVLGGPFFSDAMGDISSKDDVMVLHRAWIMEWSELDHITGKRQAAHIKSFLSRSTDVFRRPYERATGEHPRRGIIVGTTNRTDGLLRDDTGNRRFWIIPTTATQANPIDVATLATERDALWSGAMAAYRAGEPSHLPSTLAAAVTGENEAYVAESPWLEAITTWLQHRHVPGDAITTSRLLTDAVEMPLDRLRRADQMEVASVMRSLGYDQQRVQRGGARLREWVPNHVGGAQPVL
jgi:predicted P-loop ATPase